MLELKSSEYYEKTIKGRYKAFTSTSLISIWPCLYRSPIVWVALIINAFASLLSIYTSTFLSTNTPSSNYAFIVLLVTTVVGLTMSISGTLVSWICLIEENTVRFRLIKDRTENASLANIDLPIAISTISFYIMVPAQLTSIALYFAYILYKSPITILYLLILIRPLS